MKAWTYRKLNGEASAVGFYDPYCIVNIIDKYGDGEFRMEVPTTLAEEDLPAIAVITMAVFGQNRVSDCIAALRRSTRNYGWVFVCRLDKDDMRRLAEIVPEVD